MQNDPAGWCDYDFMIVNVTLSHDKRSQFEPSTRIHNQKYSMVHKNVQLIRIYFILEMNDDFVATFRVNTQIWMN